MFFSAQFVRVFFLEIYLPTDSKGRNSSKQQNRFCTKNEMSSKYLFGINWKKKIYRNPAHFVVSQHLTRAFISLTRKMDADFINTCMNSKYFNFVSSYKHMHIRLYMLM